MGRTFRGRPRFQSSPGLAAGCYPRPSAALWSGKTFQSSPGLAAGCYLTRGQGPSWWRPGFNPHPASRPGATLCAPWGAPTAPRSFNPHPASRPGATPHASRGGRTARRFQSSPGLAAGCYRQVPVLLGPRIPVSILTRLRGRVLPSSSRRPSPATGSFNPHPASRPGATRTGQAIVMWDDEVSILTRPRGRVLRPIPSRSHARPRFQSSPGLAAGCYD
ncbi:hypothetical protein STH318 [Symbiobacterium thermophilum IAM 14863]|nr:hypothetical protein STH318 [Symbiobacterium thermophilum IAM 14863]